MIQMTEPIAIEATCPVKNIAVGELLVSDPAAVGSGATPYSVLKALIPSITSLDSSLSTFSAAVMSSLYQFAPFKSKSS